MQMKIKDQKEITILPEGFEDIIGYQTHRDYRWIVIYYDPITAEVLPRKGASQRINVLDYLQDAEKKADGDIQKFQYKKMRRNIEGINKNRSNRDRDRGSFIDNDNPWRWADYGMDGGASQDGVMAILNHPFIQQLISELYQVPKGEFMNEFLKGNSMLLFDRENMTLSGGDKTILDVVEDVSWKLKSTKKKTVMSCMEAKMKLNKVLAKRLIKRQEIQSEKNKIGDQSNVISMQKFLK